MRQTRTLHVPLDHQLYIGIRERSTEMGFSSVQAYFRFWATAEVSSQSQKGDLSQPKAQAMRYVELVLARQPQEFLDLEQVLLFLAQHIRKAGGYRALKRSGVSTLYRTNPDK